MRTIAHLYDRYDTAIEVARALQSAGFGQEAVSVVANQGGAEMSSGAVAAAVAETDASTAAGTGASIGTLLGGGAGLLAGIGALAIPGVGPVVAAGWLVAAITGAGAGAGIGGLVGALAGSGVKAEHAHVYAEGVRRGDALVTLRTEEERAEEAERIMRSFGPADISEREAAYRAEPGWSGFDTTSGVMTPAELQAEDLRISGAAL